MTHPLLHPGYDDEPHAERIVRDPEGTDKREITVQWHPDRVEWLFSQGRIGARQHAAANRLATDAYLRQTVSYASSVLVGASGGTGDSHPSERTEAAMKRHGAARLALGMGWGLVEAVVEKNMTVGKAAGILHIGEKQAMGMLWLALHTLADHYGFPRDEVKTGKIRGGAALPVARPST